ncbi:hypothetical protein OG730_00585 [Streptomyces sp. NBC_01298]|uniref:hypothetical protein n=1 Tax=Streptomyces sp. NBC_01298 TaxID=2903817 RepID=UPI002E11210C|nr:hypothetical protein OG730_00585 [Streptomyces sp. NBC_01298]
MRFSARTIAISLATAVTLGVGSQAAVAASTPAPAPAQSANVLQLGNETIELNEAEVAQWQRLAQELSGDDRPQHGYGVKIPWRAFIDKLKGSPKLFKAAIGKAKAGHGAFQAWIGKQNIVVRGAWVVLGGAAQNEAINYLASLTQ